MLLSCPAASSSSDCQGLHLSVETTSGTVEIYFVCLSLVLASLSSFF